MRNVLKNTMLGLISCLCLVSCGFNNSNSSTSSSTSYITGSNSNNSTNDNSSNIDHSENSNAIVVYFSATNNTERVAQTIASYIKSPIYELEPVDPYSSADLNYSNSNSRVSKEHNDSNRHVELKNIKFDGFDEANYVFLGAPVWWMELSWVIDDFVELNNFEGKTIIPFGTSASSGFSTSNLEKLASNANWLSGQRFSSRVSTNDVESWVNSLKLSI